MQKMNKSHSFVPEAMLCDSLLEHFYSLNGHDSPDRTPPPPQIYKAVYIETDNGELTTTPKVQIKSQSLKLCC